MHTLVSNACARIERSKESTDYDSSKEPFIEIVHDIRKGHTGEL